MTLDEFERLKALQWRRKHLKELAALLDRGAVTLVIKAFGPNDDEGKRLIVRGAESPKTFEYLTGEIAGQLSSECDDVEEEMGILGLELDA